MRLDIVCSGESTPVDLNRQAGEPDGNASATTSGSKGSR
jgi:hypothetical protein